MAGTIRRFDGWSAMKNEPTWRDILRGNILAMGLVSLFTDMSSEMIFPLLPIFFTGLVPVGTAALYVGLMEGVAESTASLLKIISGHISDKLGKRKALVATGYGLSTIGRPLMAVAAAGWHVVALRFLDRVGKGIRTAPRDALISDSVDAKYRGFGFGFHRAMDHSGAIIGSLLAVAILYAQLGYGIWSGSTAAATDREMHALRFLFGLALIPGLLSILTIWKSVREIRPGKGIHSAKPPSATNPSGHQKFSKRFHVFIGILVLFALGNSSDLFIVFYAKTRFQLGLLQVIGLWITLHVSKIVFGIPGSALSDRLGRRPLIVAGWLVYATVYLGFAGVNSGFLMFLLVAAYGVYYGLTEGAEKALVADLVPGTHRARAFGLYHGAVGIAALPASIIFGLIWRGYGPAAAFGFGACLAGVAVILLMVFLSLSPRSE